MVSPAESSFCVVCGTPLAANEHLPHVPQICPACHDQGNEAMFPRETHDGHGEIIGGCWEGNRIHIVTYLNDLGPARRPASIDRWPGKVFEVLCESHHTEGLATRWTFYASMLPALKRIIAFTGRTFVLYDRE